MGLMRDVSNARPTTPATPKAARSPTKKRVIGELDPKAPTIHAATKAPIANNEPWARFNIPITPRMILNPREVRNRKEAKYNPFNIYMTQCSMNQTFNRSFGVPVMKAIEKCFGVIFWMARAPRGRRPCL
jgi:hypothetical protein